MKKRELDVESVVKVIASKRLTEIRRWTGLSQTRFAKSLDLTKSGYRNYECGSRQLPQSVRLAVLRHCGEDPLSTADMTAALANGKMPALDEERSGEETASFWATLRVETREFRRRNILRRRSACCSCATTHKLP